MFLELMRFLGDIFTQSDKVGRKLGNSFVKNNTDLWKLVEGCKKLGK
ncbi:hypothetical protein SAMN05421663_102492 [Terribacillus halophilus]|uniref:Uncharacterized protein n=1 Tax=Terribacillus halophilus TaxID=361279 RepID=A0A1G6LSS5_9BACI|nr:hypothetical protein SAMN05421663_102492 [Terribacillus halophilus]